MRKKSVLIMMLLCFMVASFAQRMMLKGTVMDNEGNAVPFATVKVKGAKKITTSDEAGQFSLDLSSNERTIEISALGFKSMTVEVSQGMTVVLSADARTISPVTITALGFKRAKDVSTFSNVAIKGNAVQKSGEANLINGLTSKAAGVNISRTGGDPGAGAYILIRGQSTISGGTQPLIVLDGVPISNSTVGSAIDGVAQQSRLNDLNPADIESIEILKGAAAAALWGARAANGVIVVTSKKGKNTKGKVNISFQSVYSIDELNKSVPLQRNYGQGNNGLFRYNYARSWGDKIADRAGGADEPINPSGEYLLLPDGSKRYPLANGTAANPSGGKRSRETYDHSKELFHNGSFWDNNISFTGGDEKGNFFLSLGNMEQQGILKAGSDYKRRTIRFSSDRKIDFLTIRSGITYTYSQSNRVQQGSNLNGIFLGGLRTPADFDNAVYEGTYVDASGVKYFNKQVAYRNAIGKANASGYDNPFWVINNITNESKLHRFIPTVEVDAKITNWLSLVNRTGLDYYLDSRIENFPAISSGTNAGGLLTEQTISEAQINNDVLLRAQTSRFRDFDISGIIGFNYNNRNSENIGAAVRGFILPDAPFDLGNSSKDQRTPFNAQTTTRVNGLYAQGNMGYKDMLFVDLSGRYERYSTLKDAFFYPSAAVAYVFRSAQTDGNKNILSFGKVRASFGQVGVPPGAYAWDTYFGPATEFESWGPGLDASSAIYGGGYARSGLQGNPDLKPEIKTEFELGGDFRFWNDRINLGATYYNSQTKDVILNVAVPPSTGFDTKLDNIGTIKNRGIELDLGANWMNTRDLKLTSNLIFSMNRNEVTDMGGTKTVFLNGFTGSSSRAVEGQPLGALWGVDFLRDPKGALVLDANGFPVANSEEGVIGNPNPDWIGSFNTSVSFKGFTVSFLIDHVQGGDVWNGTKGALYTFGTHEDVGNEVVSSQALKTATGAVIAANTPFRGMIRDFGAGPVALTQSWFENLGGGFGPVGSQFVEDGTRTRLREISLSYTLSDQKLLKPLRIQSVDFSFTGRNLALWTDYSGIDPETNLTGPSNGRGLDYFNNPSTRSYLMSVKINY